MTLYPVKVRLVLLVALASSPAALGTWPQPLAAAGPVARSDAFGDPLPADAIRRIGSSRFRPGGGIQFLLPCPDGKTLLSSCVGGDRAVYLWDLATGRLLRRFPGSWTLRPLTQSPTLALAPGGTVLATTDNEGIRLCDFASGRVLHRLKGDEYGNFSLAFSPDGRLLASVGFAGVRLWNVATGAEVARLRQTPPAYRNTLPVAFTPDGKTLIVGLAANAKVHIWDVASRRKVREFAPTNGIQPWSLALSPDRTLLAAGSSMQTFARSDGIIPLWDVATGKVIRRLHCDPASAVTNVAFSPDGKLLASVHLEPVKGSTVQLWDVATGKPRCSFKANTTSMAFARDGKILFTAHSIIRRWDVKTGKEVGAPGDNQYPITTLALSPDGRLLAAVNAHEVRLRDTATGRSRERLAPPGEYPITCAFAPDGKTLATATTQGVLRLWNIAASPEARLIRESVVGKPKRNLPRLGVKGERLAAVAFAPDGKTLATSTWAGTVRLVDTRTGAERWRITQGEQSIDSLGFTPDGRCLFAATRTREGTLLGAWDVSRGEELRSLTATINLQMARIAADPFNYFNQARLALSPDGRMLALNRGKAISVWETASGKERLRLRGHTEPVQAIAFAPDARVLASAARDETIRLWDLATGAELPQLRGHQGNAGSLCFSPDGKVLYSAGEDTTILVWDVGRVLRRGLPGVPRRDEPAAWADLAASDAGRAYRAMHALRADPAAALALFRKRLRPAAPADGKRLAQWLRDLDAARFDVRDQAARELARWDEQAEPFLRRALADKPSLEVRRRIEDLLGKLIVPSGEPLRSLRALEVLENLGSAEAQQFLQSLAKGAPEARLTREAKAALRRLAKRSESRP